MTPRSCETCFPLLIQCVYLVRLIDDAQRVARHVEDGFDVLFLFFFLLKMNE